MKRKPGVILSRAVGLVIVLTLCFPLYLFAADSMESKRFDFEDGTNMGFFVDEGGALTSAELSNSALLKRDGNTGALELATSFAGDREWHELRIAVELDERIGNYQQVEYEIFIPGPLDSEGGFKAQTIIKDANWGWTEIGELEFFGLDGETVIINGQEYLKISKKDRIDQGEKPNKQLLIRLAGYKVDYTGPVYVDNIILEQSDAQLLLPEKKAKITEKEEVPGQDKAGEVTWQLPEEGQQFTYHFSKSVMGWHKAWGESFGEIPVEHGELNGEGVLKVNVAFAGTNWQEGNISTWLKGDQNTKYDLTRYQSVDYEILIPKTREWEEGFARGGVFKVATALNDTWAEFATWKDYQASDLELVTIGEQSYYRLHLNNPLGQAINRTNSGKLVIRLSAWNIDYQGPIFVDNITLALPQDFTIFMEKPQQYQVVKGLVELELNSQVPEDMQIEEVLFLDQYGQRIVLQEKQGVYTGKWDTTNTKEGFVSYTVHGVGRGPAGETVKVAHQGEVFVKNSSVQLEILSPVFDSVIKGDLTLSAQLTAEQAEAVEQVVFRLAGKTYQGIKKANGTYTAKLDTTALEDGVYTVIVTATTAEYATSESVDFVIENSDIMNLFVETRGSEFVVGNSPFYFAGWNTYHLPFRLEEKITGNQKVVIYTKAGEKIERLIKDGTVISFKDHVDRIMLEAKRLGLSVVRTWGFNNRTEEEIAYYREDAAGNWVPNQAQFARMDYVLDSARRHGVRVIICLEDYWDHYGGIVAAARHFGLEHTLQWFADEEAQQHYQAHIARFFNRINTVNGLLYKEDPTILAWDLMNEPRMDYNHDTTVDKHLADLTGEKLAGWLDQISTYAKSLEPRQLIFVGAEGHGILRRGGLNQASDNYWAGTQEGWGIDPIGIMDQPNIDFFSIHPYPTVEWADFTLKEAINLVEDFVAQALEHNKPIVMSEWGIRKTAPLRDPAQDNQLIYPDEQGYEQLRVKWNREFLKAFNQAGGNGNNIWMLQTNAQESNYGINVYYPDVLVEADRKFTLVLQEQAAYMNNNTGQLNRAQFIHLLMSRLNLELSFKDKITPGFKDVQPDAWYYHSVNRAAQAGLLGEPANGYYRPEAALTYEQLISVLVRTYELQKGPIILGSGEDVTNKGEVFAKARQLGLLAGWAEGFAGQDIINRINAEQGMARLVELLNEKSSS